MLYPDILRDRRLPVLLALAGAIAAAGAKGNALAILGILYYALCAAAVWRRDPRAFYLLWLAVAIHSFLALYLIWRLLTSFAIPCHFCMLAAGFAFLAATAWTNIRWTMLPAVLLLGGWLAWPYAFGADGWVIPALARNLSGPPAGLPCD